MPQVGFDPQSTTSESPVSSSGSAPSVETSDPSITTQPQPGTSAAQAKELKARILIVDDNDNFRKYCQLVLETGGWLADQVASGPTALETVYARPCDLVLLDVHMPGMGGTEVRRQLRRVPPCANLKIIMLSGDASADEMAQMLADGADDYLGKPFSPRQFLARVNAALRLKAAQDRSDRLTERLEAAYGDLERRVQERTAELATLHEDNERMLAAISSILIRVDGTGRITKWNKTAEEVFNLPEGDVLGRAFESIPIPWADKSIVQRVLDYRKDAAQGRIANIPFIRADGKKGFLDLYVTPLPEVEAEACPGLLVLAEDLTERRLLEAQLAQAQKLESIGQLAAGIAHEINTPIQYVGDNTIFLRDTFRDLCQVVEAYDGLVQTLDESALAGPQVEELKRCLEQADLAYLRDEIPRAFEQTLEGVARVAHIVRAMKEFSHPDSEEKTAVDLNHTIDNTIMVARNEWKYVAEVVKDYDPALPPVPCLQGEFNQVILNLLVNASHAIAERLGAGTSEKGTITVSTRALADSVEIRIRDTGTGIPEAICGKVFDPFFTTKPVGKGTGQGLAIAHAVIVKKHSGTLTFETEPGVGTTFIIRLPLEEGKAS